MPKAFVPSPGQVDLTHARYAPVVNTVVTHRGKVLLVKRSPSLRLYPNYWNGISGFLDDSRSVAEKVYQELHEELGIKQTDVRKLTLARPLLQEAPDYGKTWIVVPAHAELATTAVQLDWEAAKAQWFSPEKAKTLQLVPGFLEVLAEFL